MELAYIFQTEFFPSSPTGMFNRILCVSIISSMSCFSHCVYVNDMSEHCKKQ